MYPEVPIFLLPAIGPDYLINVVVRGSPVLLQIEPTRETTLTSLLHNVVYPLQTVFMFNN